MSFHCFVNTSSKARRPASCRAKTSVREFGDQDGSSPATNFITSPPFAGITQMSKPPPHWEVKAIHCPSGDQSGSVGFETPEEGMRSTGPPEADTLHKARRSLVLLAKQIHLLSGDQHGADSSSLDRVRRLTLLPLASATYKSVQPSLLRIIATLVPAGAGAGLRSEPPNQGTGLRAPDERS